MKKRAGIARALMLEADLLFFDEPTAYLRRLDDARYSLNAFNSDCGDVYTVDQLTARDQIGRRDSDHLQEVPAGRSPPRLRRPSRRAVSV